MITIIMTSNIWGDYFGNEVQVREDQLQDVYAQYFPDILGMQDATNSWNDSALFASLAETYDFARRNYAPLCWKRELFHARECGYVDFPRYAGHFQRRELGRADLPGERENTLRTEHPLLV